MNVIKQLFKQRTRLLQSQIKLYRNFKSPKVEQKLKQISTRLAEIETQTNLHINKKIKAN